MTLIIFFWLCLVVSEAYRDYRKIEIHHRNPNHTVSAILRAAAGTVYWILVPIVFPGVNMEPDQWWAIPIMEAFTFWFVFDLSLNWMRGKYLYYLGTGSFLDRWQKRTIGEWPAFFFKFLLAAASVTLCYEGLRAVLFYQY